MSPDLSNREIIQLGTLDKIAWLRNISNIRNRYSTNACKKNIVFEFSEKLSPEKFVPIHLVSLACLIEFFYDNGHKIWLSQRNAPVFDMLFNQLRFNEYWESGIHHVEAKDNNIFNLWRIVDSQKDIYAKGVENYFKKTFFEGKDLSVINISLVEAFYNVFDHADAGDNAFSLIKYDPDKERLLIGICDFGKGIARSVRDYEPSIFTDKDALLKSIDTDFSVKSRLHNQGKGLDNILNSADFAMILSNNGILLKSGGIRAYETGLNFGGTLISLTIDLSRIENEEILNDFYF